MGLQPRHFCHLWNLHSNNSCWGMCTHQGMIWWQNSLRLAPIFHVYRLTLGYDLTQWSFLGSLSSIFLCWWCAQINYYTLGYDLIWFQYFVLRDEYTLGYDLKWWDSLSISCWWCVQAVQLTLDYDLTQWEVLRLTINMKYLSKPKRVLPLCHTLMCTHLSTQNI